MKNSFAEVVTHVTTKAPFIGIQHAAHGLFLQALSGQKLIVSGGQGVTQNKLEKNLSGI